MAMIDEVAPETVAVRSEEKANIVIQTSINATRRGRRNNVSLRGISTGKKTEIDEVETSTIRTVEVAIGPKSGEVEKRSETGEAQTEKRSAASATEKRADGAEVKQSRTKIGGAATETSKIRRDGEVERRRRSPFEAGVGTAMPGARSGGARAVKRRRSGPRRESHGESRRWRGLGSTFRRIQPRICRCPSRRMMICHLGGAVPLCHEAKTLARLADF